MRDSVVSVVTVLAVVVSVKCTDVGKDGFNFYKDYLRARSDEGLPDEPTIGERMYFYRTPLQLYPGLLPALEQEYKKRTGNAFKNHMLNKELLAEDVPRKRSSKSALALMLEAKPIQEMRNYCPYGK